MAAPDDRAGLACFVLQRIGFRKASQLLDGIVFVYAGVLPLQPSNSQQHNVVFVAFHPIRGGDAVVLRATRSNIWRTPHAESPLTREVGTQGVPQTSSFHCHGGEAPTKPVSGGFQPGTVCTGYGGHVTSCSVLENISRRGRHGVPLVNGGGGGGPRQPAQHGPATLQSSNGQPHGPGTPARQNAQLPGQSAHRRPVGALQRADGPTAGPPPQTARDASVSFSGPRRARRAASRPAAWLCLRVSWVCLLPSGSSRGGGRCRACLPPR